MKRILIFLIAWVFVANAQGTLDTTAGWQYRIPITIQASMVDTDLDSFPFYFPLDSSLAAFWSNVNADGSDIRVTKADKVTLCYAQLDTFNFSKADSAGELYWHGDASSTTDTKFYLYYGYSGAVADWSNQVWNEQYAAVYHFSENPENGNLQDWTANGYNGTAQGGMDASDLVDGQIGAASAWDFDGVNDHVGRSISPISIYTAIFVLKNKTTITAATPAKNIASFDILVAGNFMSFGTVTSLIAGERLTIVSDPANAGNRTAYQSDLTTEFKLIAIRWNGSKYDIIINDEVVTTINYLGKDAALITADMLNFASHNNALYADIVIDDVLILTSSPTQNVIYTIHANLFSPATFAIAGEIEAVNVQSNSNNQQKKSRYKGFGTGFKGKWSK